MQCRNLRPFSRPQGLEPDEQDEKVWPRRASLAHLAARLVLGMIFTAGSAMIFAPGLSQRVVELPQADVAGAHIHHVQVGAFSPDGRTFATCGLDQSVRLWDATRLNDGAASAPVVLRDDTVKYSVAFSADGSLLGTVGPKSLTIWSARSGQFAPVFRKATVASSCLAFSPDGHTLAIGSDDGEVSLHDLPSERTRAVLYAHSNAVRSLAFSPDGNYLVSAGQDSLIMLWDATLGVPIRPLLKGAANPNHVVAFSPDGASVAVGENGSMPTDVLVIDSGTAVVRARLTGHAQGVCALAFSPDGCTLASTGADHSVKLWNVALGKEEHSLSYDVGSVNSLTFSQDGAWLAFGGDGVTIKARDNVCPKLPRIGFVPLPNTDSMAATIEGTYGEPRASARPVRPSRNPVASSL